MLAVAAAGPLAGAQRSGDAPVGLDLVFALSAAGRLAAAFLALRVDERGAASLGELRRAAAGGLACAVARVHGRARASILAALRARAK